MTICMYNDLPYKTRFTVLFEPIITNPHRFLPYLTVSYHFSPY